MTVAVVEVGRGTLTAAGAKVGGLTLTVAGSEVGGLTLTVVGVEAEVVGGGQGQESAVVEGRRGVGSGGRR